MALPPANGAIAGQWTGSGSTAQQWTIGTVGQVQSSSAPAQAVRATANQMAPVVGNGVQVYPNPFSSTFYLTVDDPASVKEIAVFDVSGRQVERIGHSSVSATMSLGGSLCTGEYVVKVFGTGGVKTFKLIKINK